MRNMSRFNRLMNDIVDLEKNGKIFEKNIKAVVNAVEGRITIFRDDINIEEGDYLIRHLPNGILEHYIVLDRGFSAGVKGMIPAHYQCKVKKNTNINTITNKNNAIENNTIINYGKLNMNSVDTSINLLCNAASSTNLMYCSTLAAVGTILNISVK